MKDDNYSGDLHAWIEPEIEARVVALLLGEASDFEAEELERLMEERPEIRTFKRRLEGVHGLVGMALAPGDDEEWKLPPEKRASLLQSMEISASGGEALPRAGGSAEGGREDRIRRAGRRMIWGVAACFAVTLFLFLFASPRMAMNKAARKADGADGKWVPADQDAEGETRYLWSKNDNESSARGFKSTELGTVDESILGGEIPSVTAAVDADKKATTFSIGGRELDGRPHSAEPSSGSPARGRSSVRDKLAALRANLGDDLVAEGEAESKDRESVVRSSAARQVTGDFDGDGPDDSMATLDSKEALSKSRQIVPKFAAPTDAPAKGASPERDTAVARNGSKALLGPESEAETPAADPFGERGTRRGALKKEGQRAEVPPGREFTTVEPQFRGPAPKQPPVVAAGVAVPVPTPAPVVAPGGAPAPTSELTSERTLDFAGKIKTENGTVMTSGIVGGGGGGAGAGGGGAVLESGKAPTRSAGTPVSGAGGYATTRLQPAGGNTILPMEGTELNGYFEQAKQQLAPEIVTGNEGSGPSGGTTFGRPLADSDKPANTPTPTQDRGQGQGEGQGNGEVAIRGKSQSSWGYEGGRPGYSGQAGADRSGENLESEVGENYYARVKKSGEKSSGASEIDGKRLSFDDARREAPVGQKKVKALPKLTDGFGAAPGDGDESGNGVLPAVRGERWYVDPSDSSRKEDVAKAGEVSEESLDSTRPAGFLKFEEKNKQVADGQKGRSRHEENLEKQPTIGDAEHTWRSELSEAGGEAGRERNRRIELYDMAYRQEARADSQPAEDGEAEGLFFEKRDLGNSLTTGELQSKSERLREAVDELAIPEEQDAGLGSPGQKLRELQREDTLASGLDRWEREGGQDEAKKLLMNNRETLEARQWSDRPDLGRKQSEELSLQLKEIEDLVAVDGVVQKPLEIHSRTDLGEHSASGSWSLPEGTVSGGVLTPGASGEGETSELSSLERLARPPAFGLEVAAESRSRKLLERFGKTLDTSVDANDLPEFGDYVDASEAAGKGGVIWKTKQPNPVAGARISNQVTEEVRYSVDAEDPVGDPATTREIGVTLGVTPTLLADGTIRMKMRPRSAQIVEGFTGQSGNKYSRVSESMLEKISQIPDGHSVIVGGIYGEVKKEGGNKVPLLGDIPEMNLFFKNEETAKEAANVAFVVTPKSLKPESKSGEQVAVDVKVLRLNSGLNANATSQVDWFASLAAGGVSAETIGNLNSLFGLENPGAATGGTAAARDRAIVLSPEQITGVLGALAKGGLVTQTSNPTLITEDNEQATISLIDRVPILTTTVNHGGAIPSGEANVIQAVRWDVPLAAWKKIQGGQESISGRMNANDLLSDANEPGRGLGAQEALEGLGVAFPEGATARYVPSTGQFEVRQTPRNLARIDELVTGAVARVKAEREVLKDFEKNAADQPFSTFSLHVSDVSFKLAMAALEQGHWPKPDKVRVEEFVNSFDYGDPAPTQEEKVACQIEQAAHPFMQQRNLVRISMRTAALGRSAGTPLRLTVLLDNSGSMDRADRAEAVRNAFNLLAGQLNPQDQITLISFARTPRLLADRMAGDKAAELAGLVDATPSEGGTNLEEALRLGITKANEQKLEGSQNRIILLTDGAANLGNAKPEELAKLVGQMRQQGIAFDACGVGAEGLNDEILESLTRKGDGRYYFLDRPEDADAGFAKQIAGALRPAAKNVKVQVNFNPNRVGSYKLYGFEKHRLKKEDFRNDSVDAAELAAEEAGNAVYQVEVLPEGEGEIGTVSVRFQDTATGKMVEKKWTIPFVAAAPRLAEAEPALRLASSAALLGETLKESIIGQSVDLDALSKLVNELQGAFPADERVKQLMNMTAKTRELSSAR